MGEVWFLFQRLEEYPLLSNFRNFHFHFHFRQIEIAVNWKLCILCNKELFRTLEIRRWRRSVFQSHFNTNFLKKFFLATRHKKPFFSSNWKIPKSAKLTIILLLRIRNLQSIYFVPKILIYWPCKKITKFHNFFLIYCNVTSYDEKKSRVKLYVQ